MGSLCTDKAHSCVFPILPRGVTLYKIGFVPFACSLGAGEGTQCDEFVLFAGSPAALGVAIKLSDYSPRGFVRSLPRPIVGLLLHLPGVAELAVVFTFHVSAALALLNLAPVRNDF